MEGNSDSALPGWPSRRHYLVLAVVFAAVAAYGSLVPLRPQPLGFGAAIEQFRAVLQQSLTPRSRTDWVANLLLFVPLGYCLLGAMAVGSRKPWRAVLGVPLVLLLCLGWSLTIEFAQLWFPGRTPSLSDIVAQMIGTAVGVVLWLLMGQALSDWLPSWGVLKRRQDPAVWALEAYSVALFVCSMLPLDLTLSPVQLVHKYQEGRIVLVPFAEVRMAVGPLAALLRDVAIFIPLGMLAATWLVSPPRRVRGMLGGVLLGGLAVLLIESAQLLVFSRRTATGDLLTGVLGVAIGVWLMRRWRGRGQEGLPQGEPHLGGRRVWLCLALAGAYAILLSAVFCTPFNPIDDRALIRSRLAEFEFVPFAAMYRGNPVNAVAQVVLKTMFCAPLGVLLALAVAPLKVPRPIRRILLGVALLGAAGVFTAVELAQVVLPPHVPGVTDVILCTAGVALGMFVTVRFVDGRRNRT